MNGVCNFYNYVCKNRAITKNKSLELQISRMSDPIAYFQFDIGWTRQGDHCGFSIRIELWKLFIDFNIRDNRHWNWEAGRFMIDGEVENEDDEWIKLDNGSISGKVMLKDEKILSNKD